MPFEMRSNNVEVLMMSKRFLVVLVFFGFAFIAVAGNNGRPAPTEATDSVSMERAPDQVSSSDSTPGGSEALEAATASLTGQLGNTDDSETQFTTKSETSVDGAEATEPAQGTTKSAAAETAGDSAAESVASATLESDSGTSVPGAPSTISTPEVAGEQSTENGLLPHPETASSIASEKEVTTESEKESSAALLPEGGASQTGEEPAHGTTRSDASEAAAGDSATASVARATQEAKVTTEETTEVDEDKVKDKVEDKSTTGKESLIEVTPARPDEDRLKGVGTSRPTTGIWEAHRGLFLGIIIMVTSCIVIGALCFVCIKCREKSSSDKQRITLEEGVSVPMEASSPIPDAEMVKDEAPMQEVENPAVTPNGGGQHISKDEEDNGWVVPLEELSKTEKEKPETENTKL